MNNSASLKKYERPHHSAGKSDTKNKHEPTRLWRKISTSSHLRTSVADPDPKNPFFPDTDSTKFQGSGFKSETSSLTKFKAKNKFAN